MRLYVHWPFCLSRCAYCDFNSRVSSGARMSRYRAALLRETAAWASLVAEEDRMLASIYMGGGTPSTMSGSEVCELLAQVTEGFTLTGDAEVSVEVNPATWSPMDYEEARAGGVNRFSIGVQSLDDAALRLLGRAHNADDARMAVGHALSCAPVSVSVDLMFGLPGMDTPGLESCLDEILGLGPHHVSLYGLTLSGDTSLSRAVKAGEAPLPEEGEYAGQYMAAVERLCAAGYEHYEVSNFCLPGHRCSHNAAYWERQQYLGVGAGAHSLIGRSRLRNTASLLHYMHMLEGGMLAVEGCETLNDASERQEVVILGLRTSKGVDEGLLDDEQRRLDGLAAGGFLEREEGCVRLTSLGMLLSNELISALLPA